MLSGIFTIISDWFFSPYKDQGIHPGFPDSCHLMDGWMEWTMHGQCNDEVQTACWIALPNSPTTAPTPFELPQG